MAGMNVVAREEFKAVKGDGGQGARDENERLAARVAALKGLNEARL